MRSFPAARLLGLILAGALIPACLSSNPNRTAPQPTAPTTVSSFKAAVLSGRQEVPPVMSSGTGNATVSLNSNRTEITVTVEVAGLADITEAHLHAGRPGADGPIIFPLATSSFTSPLTVTLTQADFLPASDVATYDAALLAIERGDTYVNVHTSTFPDGEIRGQVGPVSIATNLTGSQVVPTSVVTPATGTMSLTLSPDQSSMMVVFTQTDLGVASAANIRAGQAGINGPIIFPLAQNFYQVPLTTTLTSATFTPQPGIATFEDAVDLILSGNAYVDVSTAANPNGEIRGQIIPKRDKIDAWKPPLRRAVILVAGLKPFSRLRSSPFA
jgi:hypothetical protein